jgi:spore coat protein JB
MQMSGNEGRLQAMAPLANPYVPFQLADPPKYNANEAVIRGTLFPGLDLPFMGKVNKTNLPNTPLAELQTLSFVIQELALYLDTHKDDTEATEMYHQYQKLYCEGTKKYEQIYGPLNHMTVGHGEYRWLNDPWPWEYAENREV